MTGFLRRQHPRILFLLLIFALLTSFFSTGQAQSANHTCIKRHLSSASLGIVRSDAEQLIADVGRSIGVSRGITIVPCSFASKAQALSISGSDSDVPLGEYIIYDEEWVREVIGEDRIQAIALFGHEFGHFLNRHFGSRQHISRTQKEIEADKFAGCAVARLGGDWASLESLLARLRSTEDDLYPDRLTSLEAARSGFEECGNTNPPPTTSITSAPTLEVPVGYQPTLNTAFATRVGDFDVQLVGCSAGGAIKCQFLIKNTSTIVQQFYIQTGGGTYIFNENSEQIRSQNYTSGVRRNQIPAGVQITADLTFASGNAQFLQVLQLRMAGGRDRVDITWNGVQLAPRS